MLEEGVHGRHQYLATAVHSAPLGEGLAWLKNTNTQLLYRLYCNAPKDWRKELLEEYSNSQYGERVHNNAVKSLPHIQNMQITYASHCSLCRQTQLVQLPNLNLDSRRFSNQERFIKNLES